MTAPRNLPRTSAATALGGACEVIGDAIDQGTFEGLPDSILVWDVMRVDMAGYEQGHAIVERAVGELIALGNGCRERVQDLPPEQVFLVSYLLSTFESPERPEKK